MIAVSYIMKRKIKKIFFEVISNSKIFNINFFQQNSKRPRFSQTYRGAGQRRIQYYKFTKIGWTLCSPGTYAFSGSTSWTTWLAGKFIASKEIKVYLF